MKSSLKKVFLLLIPLACIFGCSAKNPSDVIEDFGADEDYFLGLKLLNEGKENEAIIKFKNCINQGTYYCAQRSAWTLAAIGSVQERNTYCGELVAKFDDSESKLIAARQYYSADEMALLIKLTENLNLKEENNELIRLRMEALVNKNDSRLNKEVFEWFTSRSLSSDHYKFFRDTYSERIDFSKISPQDFLISYRIDLYKRDYHKAYENADFLLEYFKRADLEPFGQIVSDIGKAYLYGNDDYYDNGLAFQDLAYTYKGTEGEFYFWFYAGRYFARTEQNYTQTINCFKNAITCTEDEKQKDNALWYMLNTKISESYETTIEELSTYASQWSDPEYFDDFFESLIMSLVVSGNWSMFPTLFEQIDGYASSETTAKIAYICGRLYQKGYIKSKNKDKQISKYFEKACYSGMSIYYKILSAYQLGLSEKDVAKLLCSPLGLEKIEVDKDAERLLKGYVHYGFPEKVYEEWNRFHRKGISTDVSMYLADFLYKCGQQNVVYLPLSLRIASRSANISDRELTKEELKLVYPRDYRELVEKYSEKYEIEPSVMFALIRSESFFDASIESSAGAIGLAQLMQMTSEDIARKLKVKEYSLTDPEINIEFGTYYLSELYNRCDKKILQAFFSYNAGITRVRRWLSSSMIEFGEKKNMPGDLFLETVPITETREYGRKLISASVMYQWLYQDEEESQNQKSYNNIVEALIY